MTPQEKKALLLRVVTKLAAQQLENGGLTPFGATLGEKREVQLLVPDRIKPDATLEELDAYWTRELRQAAAKGDCDTVCTCIHVGMQTEEGISVPALLIHIEQADAFSEDILYPYEKGERSEVIFSEPTTEAAEYQIFVPS
jgi:hypothetical protein